jgi:hypothetical protein
MRQLLRGISALVIALIPAIFASGAALAWGLYPFVFGDAIKAIVAGLAVPAAGMALTGKK